MSDVMRFEYAIQEPALSIAPVFLVQQKGNRKKLDVTRTFGVSTLHWRGPDELGIPEQSVLLGLLSIAGQQPFLLNPHNAKGAGKNLLDKLALGGNVIQTDLAVIKANWTKIVAASGSKSSGGKNVSIAKLALKRLAETTIWESINGIEYESRLLAWIYGDKEGVMIALNRRTTDAIYGGQFIKISLKDRQTLPDEPAKALHAWLSGQMRSGSTRLYRVSNLQSHVWGGDAIGSTLRSRLSKLRNALVCIGRLPNWSCALSSDGYVQIKRINQGTIDDKSRDYLRANGTIDDSNKTVN